MKSSENGNPMQCVSNLVRIVRGECVYDRIKGIDPSYIDQPEEIAAPLFVADAKWLIQTYEPRVDVDTIDMSALMAEQGSFALNINARLEEDS